MLTLKSASRDIVAILVTAALAILFEHYISVEAAWIVVLIGCCALIWLHELHKPIGEWITAFSKTHKLWTILVTVTTVSLILMLLIYGRTKTLSPRKLNQHMSESKPSPTPAPDVPSVVSSQPKTKTERKPITETPTAPPLIGDGQFFTYVVLYSDNSVLCGMDPLQFRHDACNDMSAAFKQHSHVNNDAVSELSKILQHYLVALVYSAGEGWGVMPGPVDGKFKESGLPPIDPPEFVKYPCGQIVDVCRAPH